VICSYCNKPNHSEEKCYKKARDKGGGAKVENHLIDADPVDIPELGSDLEFDVFTLQSIECNSLNSNSSRVVLLDTGAQASVSNDLSLLENVHSTDLSITINGINKDGKSIISDTVGNFPGFDEIPVYFSEHVKRNILFPPSLKAL
jgi:hypothetical protein